MTRSRRRRGDGEIDEIDEKIIDLLVRDGRSANRAVALETGLAEATVASRIRQLTDRRVLGVTVVIDWQQAGYLADAWLQIHVYGQPVRSVAGAVRQLPSVHAVFVVLGSADLLVHVLAADLTELQRMIAQIQAVPGVSHAAVNVGIDTGKYSVRYARFPVEPARLESLGPGVELDMTDRAIVAALAVDGRRSNREIAREMELSEGAVRQRLRRLESTGLLRITGQSDPFLTGLIDAWAIIAIDVRGDHRGEVARRLALFDDVLIIETVLGDHDVVAFLASRTRSGLAALILDDIRALPGVERVETWDIVSTVHLDYHLVRLVDSSGE